MNFKTTLLFSLGFLVLLGLQFYFIRNSYRLEEKELLRQAREIAIEVMNQINEERHLNEDEKSEQHWLYNIKLSNYDLNNTYPFDKQEELSQRVDSMLSKKTAGTNFKIELIHEIFSIKDLEHNKEMLPKGKTLVFYKSSGEISSGFTIVEGKWTSKHSNSNTLTDERSITSNYIQSRSIFELKNMNQLLLIQILPLSIVSAVILFLVLLVFYKNQKTIQIKLKQIKRLNTTIDTIAHELNTPLATMKFHLATTPDSDSKALLQRQINKLEQVVKSIHHESKASELATEELVLNYLQSIQNENPTITFNVALQWNKNLSLTFEDAKNMLSNLIENSIKYGGTSIDVNLQFNHSIKIQIGDNGIGIPEDEREMVFEKYYRIMQNNQLSNHGLGVGLHIVKQIVDAHNGTIFIESNLPKGSSFTLILPNEN